MEVGMEFKSSNLSFGGKRKFQTEIKGFLCEEGAKFTTEGNKAASASVDEFAEKVVRFSMEQNKQTMECQDHILDELQEESMLENQEVLDPSILEEIDWEYYSLDPEEAQIERDLSFFEEREEKQKKPDKNVEAKQEQVKKEREQEKKKLGAKTAVASMLKAKKDLSNDLVGEGVTGDAFKDGLSGLMQTFVECINPVRWGKLLVLKIAAVVAPYIAIFMAVATVVIIIVMFLFSILQPLASVGESITNFLSFFSSDGDTFTSIPFTEEEIEEIILASGCDETQELVIRYALEKVGYPYSQDLRTSGIAYDCSSLVYYCWKEAEVDISYGTNYPPTAAEGARMLNEDGKTLDLMELQPGDLIYYGGDSNGRYLGIYHVAIYIGDGKAVEALNTTYGVVYQTLRTDNAIMVCRPNKE